MSVKRKKRILLSSDRKIRWYISGLLILAVAYCFSAVAGQEVTDSIPRRIILNVTADLASSIAINWQTTGQVAESFAELAIADADPRFVDKVIRKKAETERVILGDTIST